MSTDINHIYSGTLRLKQGSAQTSGNKTEFEGIISSTAYDSDYERFGKTALESMARKAEVGVKVLAEHNHAGQPIGRSLSGEYDAETQQLKSRFYIQKGLNLRSGFNGGGYADSDSYIASAQEGTTDGLSVGALVEKETCDHCGAEMKRFNFLGMTFIFDEKGHYPGQKIYLDSEGKEHSKPGKGLTEKRITATIEKANLMEFSMVTFGANPDAHITEELQKAFENGELDEKHLAQLNDRFAIKVQGNKLIGGLPPMSDDNVSGHMSAKDADMSTKHEPIPDVTDAPDAPDANDAPEPTPPEPITVRDPALSGEYKADLVRKNVRIDELETEVSKLKVFEEKCVDLEADLRAKEEEISGLKSMEIHVEAKAVKIQKYELLCEKAVDWSVRQYVKWKSTSLRRGEDDAVRTRLSAMDDYDQIMEWGDLYRNRAIDNANSKATPKATPESILEQDHIVPELYV